METEQQYVERRLREENTERFSKEYQESQRTARAKQEAQDAMESAKRTARLAQEKALEANAKSLRDVETCPVCGTEVAKTAIVHHIYNTEDRCIRKPRQAKASGIVTEDAWDMLTDDERKHGFVIKGGATLAAVKTLKENTPELIPGAPNCFGQKLF